MKKGIHPEYREVVFKDMAADFAILTRSTVKTQETITWEDGKTYPLVYLDLSSASHPFFTGKQKLMDTAGRIDRLTKKFGAKVAVGNQKKKAAPVSIAQKLKEAAAKSKEKEQAKEATEKK
ncbi:MAG TPA: type B 50S ribosomal protein L31 [Verrucomicrobiae bacterium]|nr:type B 50S ribosomal protein L31 [Verrucomicrobiae bacterium]